MRNRILNTRYCNSEAYINSISVHIVQGAQRLEPINGRQRLGQMFVETLPEDRVVKQQGSGARYARCRPNVRRVPARRHFMASARSLNARLSSTRPSTTRQPCTRRHRATARSTESQATCPGEMKCASWVPILAKIQGTADDRPYPRTPPTARIKISLIQTITHCRKLATVWNSGHSVISPVFKKKLS